ncbi:hypothetical protein GN316_15600 [Xylophilus sp. Kf1]|nr:hypothetical protein [Xylophilus sp. Kf1]
MRFGLSSGPVFLHDGKAASGGRLAVEAMAQRLVAYEDCLLRLPDWVHPSWLHGIGLPEGLPKSLRCGPSLAAAMGVAGVPAGVFDRAANSLVLLPPACLCRVLRARALLRRRPALRRCVEPRLRRCMDDWLHPAVVDAVVLEAPDDGLQHDIDGLPWAPGVDSQDFADALAWEGLCLFQRDRTWTDPQLNRLIRLGFAADAVPPATLHRQPGAADGSRWVLDRLGLFLPEAPWLCG